MNKGVIVIGGHVQGLGIIRTFGKKNIPSILLDEDYINIAKHSKFCSKFYRYKKHTLYNFLMNKEIREKYSNWLIFPTDDKHVEIISKNKGVLKEYYKISTSDWSVISNLYNKKNTYKICDETDVNYPQTIYPDQIEDLNNLNMEFPVIIKPAIMHKFYSKTRKKVFLCNDKESLKNNYLKALQIIPKEEIMIQEIIKGSNENQFSVCFYFSNGEPIVSLMAKRKRQHPIDFGNATTFAETVNEPKEIYENSIRLLKHLNYEGVAEVEFKKDQNSNRFYLLEVNPRTWKWHMISEHSNSPFLFSIFQKIYFNKLITSNKWEKAFFRHLLTDIPISMKMIFKGIYKPVKYNKVKYAVWDKSDLLPSIFEIIYLPYFLIKR